MKHSQFDVIVVGGGHAGAEAAAASSRLGVRTALVTIKAQDLGVMSCNPAIGGLGKGHLVREIDAMGGIMGVAADFAGIQFRLLNRSKGPAVQGPRAQVDRKRYHEAIGALIASQENCEVVVGEVIDLIMKGAEVRGVKLSNGEVIESKSVVLTSGTFLRGVIHIGDHSYPGGRIGDMPSMRLAEKMSEFDLPLGRLKTGTPPRLNGKTIDWDILEVQPGDDDPVMFSFLSRAPKADQISCGITHTNEKTHEIICKNLARSAMYGGHIAGMGPRYCPSIEDKVVRFSNKSSHQVFLEPEGLTTSTVYPNGISTSLPKDVQIDYVKSIRGLEEVEIVQPGYAIEYDYVDPRALSTALQVRGIGGLFLAGQINGTTGYEEAAAQGLVAGLNAAAVSLDREAVEFSRTESYIGVMIDDLTSRGVSEPYRMFTSRAEFRLRLRADNADQRLTQKGIDLGCISEERALQFVTKMKKLDAARDQAKASALTALTLGRVGSVMRGNGKQVTVYEALSDKAVSWGAVKSNCSDLNDIDDDIGDQLKRESTYAFYLARQEKDANALKRDERLEIPNTLEFSLMAGLSNELKAKLEKNRPRNMAQAAKIEGMTPAALTLILAHVRRLDNSATA